MPANILAVGDTAADSADVVVAAGATLTVALKDAAGPRAADGDPGAVVHILLKDDAGQYFRIDKLTGDRPALVITGAGTYRFSRSAGGPAIGVFNG